MLFRKQNKKRLGKGFSILELLTVISVVSLLSVVTVPALSGVVMGGKDRQALIAVSGALEKARDYAVAKNSFVYVGFTQPNAEGKIFVGIFGANDGSTGGVSDLNKPGAALTISDARDAGGKPLVLLDRVSWIEQTQIADQVPSGSALAGNTALGNRPSFLSSGGGASFRYDSRTYGDLTFDRVLRFSPTGEAKTSELLPESVQIVLVPTRGEGDITNPTAASVVQVAGLTGQVAVFRPQGN